LQDLKDARQMLVPSNTDEGDIVSGLVAGIEMIEEHCRNLKYKRNITVITNATGNMDFNKEQMLSITEKLRGRDIILKVLFVERYDGSEGMQSEWLDDSSQQLYESNRANLTALCEGLGEFSIAASCEEAIYSLSIPRPKEVRPIKTFYGVLKLGNSDKFGTEKTVSVSVEAYPCIRKAVPPSSSAYSQDENGELKAVKYVREYFIDNPDEPDEKQDVEREELANGYKYGTEIVTFSEDDKVILKGVATEAGMEIIGFISNNKVPRWAHLGHTDFLVATSGRLQDAVGLSSLIHSLYETETFAIARYVPKNDSDIQMILLAPYFDVGFEALIISQLPFEEDYRHFRFPGLLNITNKVGEPLQDGRQKRSRYPSEQMDRAMEAYINKMDLMTADDGEEYMPSDEIFNPVIHRIQQTVKDCAISNDSENLPPMLPILKKYREPKENMLEDCEAEVEMMRELFEIKKVERNRAKRIASDSANNLIAEQSELDLDDLLGL
jgi:ATP-dependent DNA helicase 2 subunit 2